MIFLINQEYVQYILRIYYNLEKKNKLKLN